MDDFIEAVSKLVPFAKWFENIGFSKETSAALAVVSIAFFVWTIGWLTKKLVKRRQDIKASKNKNNPYFEYNKIKGATQRYIKTRFQNLPPSKEDEFENLATNIATEELISFFINKAFNKSESHKFYLILAGSGMGKTTFMINLFIKYNSFFNFKRKLDMYIYPMGEPNILDEIAKIDVTKKRNAILLLDAFDEDPYIAALDTENELTTDERFRKRLDEIAAAVKEFKEIIITSRTQYFPGQEKEDYSLNIKSYGTEEGFHRLQKLYLSPFNKKEVTQYLNKTFGVLNFLNFTKKKTAQLIVNNSTKLMARPLLLSYIELLVEAKSTFTNAYEIYETLIEKWLEREATKRKKDKTVKQKFKKDLYLYSRLAALQIYRNTRDDKQNYMKQELAYQIAKDNNINLAGYEITGQSLLIRDGEHNWKFAHKSILEFFLAKEAIENTEFRKELNFTGMDMAKLFYYEIIPKALDDFIFIAGGTFLMGSSGTDKEAEEYEKPQREVIINDFYINKYPVTIADFEKFIVETAYKTDADKDGGSYLWNSKEWKKRKGVNWKYDVHGNIRPKEAYNHPVIHISWHDASAFTKWLSDKTSKIYRLPTEAEWEYAARGGRKSKGYKYAGSNDINDVAWYDKNAYNLGKGHKNYGTNRVGSKKANELGLYDMSGNVREWCQDKWYGDYKNAPNDGSAWESGDSSFRVIRGGSWYDYAVYCRVAYRNRNFPGSRSNIIGFRLASSL